MMLGRVKAALALLAIGAAPAAAQDWNVQITPYAWGTGVGGDVRPVPGGPTLSFDQGLSEVLEDLDAAFFLSGYARRGRFVFLGDVSSSTSSRAGVVPGLGLPAQGEVEQRSLTLAAGYRAHDGPEVTVDVLAGLRHWSIEAAATTPVPGLAAGVDIDFTDPILALRTNVPLSERWSLIAYADVGGFGVGSDRTGQIVATANWQASRSVYLSAGYRHLFVDYDDGGPAVDVTFSGPLLGVTYRF